MVIDKRIYAVEIWVLRTITKLPVQGIRACHILVHSLESGHVIYQHFHSLHSCLKACDLLQHLSKVSKCCKFDSNHALLAGTATPHVGHTVSAPHHVIGSVKFRILDLPAIILCWRLKRFWKGQNLWACPAICSGCWIESYHPL